MRRSASTATATATALFLLSLSLRGVEGIGCFVCSSFNNSNPACEDPFNSTLEMGPDKVNFSRQSMAQMRDNQIANYHHPCWAFKKSRQGLFPADHCIKINGYRTSGPRHTMVIRTCALDSGTLTADTEIVRISHCGHFKYEGQQYTGCVQSCDSDGCNAARERGLSVCTALLLLGLLSSYFPIL